MLLKPMPFLRAAVAVTLFWSCAGAKPIHQYVFYGQDREKIPQDESFLKTKAFEGAQVVYSWKQLEPARDEYDFSMIRADLKLLKANGKKLWIQFQDVTFSPKRINVPQYLQDDPKFTGGA